MGPHTELRPPAVPWAACWPLKPLAAAHSGRGQQEMKGAGWMDVPFVCFMQFFCVFVLFSGSLIVERVHFRVEELLKKGKLKLNLLK